MTPESNGRQADRRAAKGALLFFFVYSMLYYAFEEIRLLKEISSLLGKKKKKEIMSPHTVLNQQMVFNKKQQGRKNESASIFQKFQMIIVRSSMFLHSFRQEATRTEKQQCSCDGNHASTNCEFPLKLHL